MANITIYKTIYFDELGLIAEADFSTEAEARAFATASSLDFYRIIKYQASRTLTDITDNTP